MKKFLAVLLASLMALSCFGVSAFATDYFVEYGVDIKDPPTEGVVNPETNQPWHTQTATVKPGDTVSFYASNPPTLKKITNTTIYYKPGVIGDTVNNVTYDAHSAVYYDPTPIDEGGSGVAVVFRDKVSGKNQFSIKGIGDTANFADITYQDGTPGETQSDVAIDYVVDHGVFDCWEISISGTGATKRTVELVAKWKEDPSNPFPVPVDNRTAFEKLRDTVIDFVMQKIVTPFMARYGEDIAILTPNVMKLATNLKDWFSALKDYFESLKQPAE
ncbi:MAG: hypothetical protein K5756_06625 [Clostridiales bacterium]|nr:hypothetical protein [Clostridiales bacterium]